MSDHRIIPPGALTRRRFCEAAGIGTIVIALPACFGDPNGNGALSTGGVDDLDAGVLPDFARENPLQDLAQKQQPIPDLAGTNEPFPDMSQQKAPPDMTTVQNACPGGFFDTKKAPNAFALNTATYFSSQDAFVCRDANGLFALSSICPHAGCTVSFKANGATFHCPCHGANFNYTGGQPTSPAHTPLDHYAMCIEGNGDVAFDINMIVAAATRLNA